MVPPLGAATPVSVWACARRWRNTDDKEKDAGVSIRRSTDPAAEGLADDRIRYGDEDGCGGDADPSADGRSAPPALVVVRSKPSPERVIGYSARGLLEGCQARS
jgi:hypothetical protein